jgi:biopolymer transport protein ExbD
MRFKRKKKDIPEVSTASLPDIIFMLLFFFMTVTVLRTAAAQVTVELPETESAIKVNHDASEYNIYIGAELDKANPKIQINEYLVSMNQLDQILESISKPLMDFEKMDRLLFKIENQMIRLIEKLKQNRDSGNWEDSYL